jgi:hypothetical protein
MSPSATRAGCRAAPRRRTGYSASIPHQGADFRRSASRPIGGSRYFIPRAALCCEEADSVNRSEKSRVFAGLSEPTAGLEPATPSLRVLDPPSQRFGSAPSFPSRYSAPEPRSIPHLFRMRSRPCRPSKFSRPRWTRRADSGGSATTGVDWPALGSRRAQASAMGPARASPSSTTAEAGTPIGKCLLVNQV